MPLFFQYLTSLQAKRFDLSDVDKTWTFYENIATLSSEEQLSLVKNYAFLAIEYSVLCAHLSHLLIHNRATKPFLVKEFESVLMMAEVLFHLNLYYLDSPKDAIRLSKEIECYRSCLNDLADYKFTLYLADELKSQKPDSLSASIAGLTGQYNPSRILFVRSRRLVLMLGNLYLPPHSYLQHFLNLDSYIAPYLPTLSWMSFVPRLFTNIFLLAKHTFPHPWMLSTEKNLHWSLRFKLMFQKNWFEVGNDTVWFTGALLNIFVFVGPLAHYAFWNSFLMQIYDIGFAYARVHYTLKQLDELGAKYHTELKGNDDDTYHQYALHLKARYEYDKARFMQSFYAAIGLTIALVFLIPSFAAIPYFHMMGAFISVFVTVLNRVLLSYIETTKPYDNLMSHIEQNRINLGTENIEPAFRISEQMIAYGLFKKDLLAKGLPSPSARLGGSQSLPNFSHLHPHDLRDVSPLNL